MEGKLLELLEWREREGEGEGRVALPTDFPYFVGWAGSLGRLEGGIRWGGEEYGSGCWP